MFNEDSNYEQLLRILGNSGGDVTKKYDSPYSIALAILEANGVDTSTKHYDSLYSILEEIEEMGGGGQEEKFTFTINPTPSDADVSINGSTGNSYEALGGEEIDWEVSKTGYTTQEGEYIMRRDDYSMNVTLEPTQVTFTITPTPADAVVVMNGVQQSSVTVNAGSTVSWSVSKTGYVTQSSTTTVYDDVTLPVTLALEQYTFTINPTPADATVVINNEERSSITADYGTAISWEVSKTGYETATGSLTLTSDVTENVVLEEEAGELTFEVVTPGNIVWKLSGNYGPATRTIEYNKNDDGWVSISSSTSGYNIPVVAGDKIKFRGNNSTYCVYWGSDYYNRFEVSDGATFYAYGDVTSLLAEGYKDALQERAFYGLFYNNTGLLSHTTKKLVLPSTTMSLYCYASMFENCTSLTTVPALPATTLASYCYNGMFSGCTSLTTAPALPATTLANYCYYYMFSGCTSLTTAPALPVTTLASYCYANMFQDCTSLTIAPALPATTLASCCYNGMFSGCTSLTTAPVLPATTLVSWCYNYMFNGCTSLNNITCLATDISAHLCTNQWVYNVAATGTFVKHPNMTSWTVGSDGIPTGWTAVNAANILFDVDVLDAVITVNGNVISGNRYFGELGETISYTISKTGYQTVSGTATMPAAVGTTVTVDGHMRQNGVDNDYFNMEVVTPGNIKFMMDNAIPSDVTRTLEYSTDNGSTWNQATISDANRSVSIPVAAGDIILWRGTQPYVHGVSGYEQIKLGFNADNGATFYAYGDLEALVVDNNQTPQFRFTQLFDGCSGLLSHPTKKIIQRKVTPNGTYQDKAFMFHNCSSLTTSPIVFEVDTVRDYEYRYMFSQCTNLSSAPALPATTLSDYCYYSMFGSCPSLATPPALPATTLASYCYDSMFEWSGITSAPALPATDLNGCPGCYEYMFAGCSSLTTPPALPATYLAYYCYYYMFEQSGLTSAPALPATNVQNDCYAYMFYGCTSLVTLPNNMLPATTVCYECYDHMFEGCSSLTTPPALPATSMAYANRCYENMFSGCTSLTTAPVLPAASLATECYSGMFQGCTSLTTAPDLNADVLEEGCYNTMFYGCTSLNNITCLATDISAQSCTNQWVQNVAATGTFTKATRMSSWTTGVDGIPSGWSIVNYGGSTDPDLPPTGED